MRIKLKSLLHQRAEFRGTVARFGSRRTERNPNAPRVGTICVENVALAATGEQVADHQWFDAEDFPGVRVGDAVTFEAEVRHYVKGGRSYRDRRYGRVAELDYKLFLGG